MPDVRIPKQEERRPPRQCNLQKGKFIADSSQGSCSIQRSGGGSESPEPKLLHKFIGWAQAVGSWFKWIGYKFAKQFLWSNPSCAGDFPGGFCPVPNWQTVGRPTPNLSCLPWSYFCSPHAFQLPLDTRSSSWGVRPMAPVVQSAPMADAGEAELP